MSNKNIHSLKCPTCNSELSSQEIQDNLCWTCHEDLNPTTTAIIFNCTCGHSFTKLTTQVPLIDGYYEADCPKCDAELSQPAPDKIQKIG